VGIASCKSPSASDIDFQFHLLFLLHNKPHLFLVPTSVVPQLFFLYLPLSPHPTLHANVQAMKQRMKSDTFKVITSFSYKRIDSLRFYGCKVSGSGRSLIQRSPTDSVVSERMGLGKPQLKEGF
jgi:hypothetical protein